MKGLIFTALLSSLLAFSGQSQVNLDSLLTPLNNNDLYIGFIIHDPWGQKKVGINKDSARDNKRCFIVSSLDEDIQTLAQKYSKKILIEKLYTLLQDPNRDLYANALLYDLLDNRKLGKLSSMNREKWINSGRKITDAVFWKDYMEKNIYQY